MRLVASTSCLRAERCRRGYYGFVEYPAKHLTDLVCIALFGDSTTPSDEGARPVDDDSSSKSTVVVRVSDSEAAILGRADEFVTLGAGAPDDLELPIVLITSDVFHRDSVGTPAGLTDVAGH